MAWQDDVRDAVGGLGLDVSSGYRTPADQQRLHSSPNSYHTRGTRAYPGALDVAGPADKLVELYRQIREKFKGRINELYLNLPGGQSSAIKNNRYLGTNPEAGRPQHLHIAIGGGAPAERIPPENRGDAAMAAAPDSSVCVRQWCHPTGKSLLTGGEERCVCWSDTWAYGAAVALILGGAFMVASGRGQGG